MKLLSLPNIAKQLKKIVLALLLLILIVLSAITLYSYYKTTQIVSLTENLTYSRRQNTTDITAKKIARLKYNRDDYAQLREHIGQIDTLILRGSSLETTTSPVNITTEKGFFVDTFKKYLSDIAPNINVFIELEGNYGLFDENKLTDEQLKSVVNTYIDYIVTNNYTGIAINNSENTSLENSPLFTALNIAIKEKGKKIIVLQNPQFIAVTPSLETKFNSVILFPQSVNSTQLALQWNTNSLLETPTTVVNSISTFVKDNNLTSYSLLLGTTSYKEIRENGVPIWQTASTYKDAITENEKAVIIYPTDKPVPTIVEKVNDFVSNYWYLADSTYVYNVKIALSKESQLLQPKKQGISSEFAPEPGVWNAISSANPQSNLAFIKTNYLIDTTIKQSGKGSILKYIKDAVPGERAVDLIDGVISSQTIIKLPENASIQRFGYKENTVAITFDDGPDRDTTPKILEILKSKGITATFYLEGSHVKTNPEIAKRIIEEGHAIANHTYNHPFTYKLPTDTYTKELSAADQIIHLTTGYKTSLYRTPFNESNLFETMSDGDNLKFLNSKGYLVSEFDIDSNDYKEISGATIKENVLKTLAETKGGQILFHDHNIVSRNELLGVLPDILDEIKAKGYEFAKSDELVDTREYYSGTEYQDTILKPVVESKNTEYWLYTTGGFLLNNMYILVLFALGIMMYWYKVV
jgi:peptidoglycan/xylan/chitin deacetylase (PgdA/CDA1 family)